MAEEANMQPKYLPVISDTGFLAGVRLNDGSDHIHRWIFWGKQIHCPACKLTATLYSVKEILKQEQLNG